MRTRLLIIDGSDRRAPWAAPAAQSLEQTLTARGAACSSWVLAEHPICTTDPASIYTATAPTGPEHPARKLMRMIRRTDGILIVTTERHGSVGGTMKCALDVLSPAEFDHKPVGVVLSSHTGTGRAAAAQLTQILELAGATPVPHCAVIDSGRPEGGEVDLAPDPVRQRVEEHLEMLLAWATQSRASRTDIDTYRDSPVVGYTGTSVRPLSEQPDAGVNWARLVAAAREQNPGAGSGHAGGPDECRPPH